MLGIDTPETEKPGYSVGCWGPEATQFAESTMTGQRVAIVLDPSQGSTDRFGRTLAYLVKEDGWNYSIEAVRNGAAESYIFGDHPASIYAEITAAQREAQNSQRGLWGAPCFGDTGSVPT